MRIRKVAAVTMAACLAASALAGCGSKIGRASCRERVCLYV